jgi:hypothetical protein
MLLNFYILTFACGIKVLGVDGNAVTAFIMTAAKQMFSLVYVVKKK